MKERPIIFSAPLVRAILDGRKSQTRRVAVPRFDDRKPCEHWHGGNDPVQAALMMRHCDHGSEGTTCPYGQPGDRLWVRETWKGMKDGGDSRPCVAYAATDFKPARCKWDSPLFMPRWASRITLEVVGVRVERVQDITEADAAAEGCEAIGVPIVDDGTGDHLGDQPSFRYGFAALWDSIYGKRAKGCDLAHVGGEAVNAYSWAANPWVWVIEFRRAQ